MAKYLIINADDLGIAVSTNLAIQEAHRRGLVTSTSLMANMPAFRHALQHVLPANPQLGVGVHLCLTSGQPVSAAGDVPLLVDGDGRFRHGFLGLVRLLRSRQAEDALAQIMRELHAQVARMDACGLPLDHVDSHHHVHMIPALFPTVAGLARQRRWAVRFPDESLCLSWRDLVQLPRRVVQGGLLKKMVLSQFAREARNAASDVLHADHHRGVLDAGRMTLSAWRTVLASLPDGMTEVNLHPGFPDRLEPSPHYSRPDLHALGSANRAAELAAVLDPSLRAELSRRNITPARFADVSR